ncbi:hypothetical protein ABH945_003258 [Paraburkholderia sp. GAS333]|uniref:hypothetical protein n=1 Tax=Paraburkholderia sp. GAS333 TaxID=3156279 RepID=UPI003D22C169
MKHADSAASFEYNEEHAKANRRAQLQQPGSNDVFNQRKAQTPFAVAARADAVHHHRLFFRSAGIDLIQRNAAALNPRKRRACMTNPATTFTG